METVERKYEELGEVLLELRQVVIAFSGGVDSTFLLRASLDFLGADNVLAVTSNSETYPSRELNEAVSLAKELGARHEVITTSELSIPGYSENTTNRCYFCKSDLFKHLLPIAERKKYNHIIFGAIADDLGEFRPGLRAAQERGIKAPLLDVGLTKVEIRQMSHQLGLRTWDKPSFACLSSRIAYGEPITRKKLSMIDQAEAFLMELGFAQVRVRQHGELARIEVAPSHIYDLAVLAGAVSQRLKDIGFQYVCLDMQGYRAGSMNEAIPHLNSGR